MSPEDRAEARAIFAGLAMQNMAHTIGTQFSDEARRAIVGQVTKDAVLFADALLTELEKLK